MPYIRDEGYGEEFKDVGDGKMSLSQGIFELLVSIRPSHLVYRSGDTYYLEPYVLSQFARQFGYDQLYAGNPNTSLAFMGSLIDGARAWRFFIAGCTEARFLTLLVGVLHQVSSRTVASTIYQNVYPPAAMWKAVLLRQASFPLNY